MHFQLICITPYHCNPFVLLLSANFGNILHFRRHCKIVCNLAEKLAAKYYVRLLVGNYNPREFHRRYQVFDCNFATGIKQENCSRVVQSCCIDLG